MQLHELKAPEGSTRERIRIGRGHGSGKVKTGGKGTKGQNARAGGGVPPYFEGGQLPLIRKLPYRRGFKNPFRVKYRESTCATSATFPRVRQSARKSSRPPACCAAKAAR